jgi:tetratricopeptide (TPR) repeat protein
VSGQATSAEPIGTDAAGTSRLLAEGLAAFLDRDLAGAHACFERAHRAAPRHALAMSWYGVTLVLVERNITLGISYCDGALRGSPNDPELLLNSARIHLALNQRQRAARAITRGLQAWPDHPGLLGARALLGTRRAPVIPGLSRDNPLNRLLGRLRHRWAMRGQAQGGLAPESLGPSIDLGAPPRS